jgi:competence protein ComEA
VGRRTIVLVVLLGSFAAGRAEASKGVDGVVNLNTAPAAVLALLPGVGPSKAAAILAYRGRRPFRTVDELVRIKGIGRKMVRRLRPHLAVAGPTTATVAALGPSTAPTSPPKPAPPPLRATGAPRCPPVRPLGRPTRTPARDREQRRPFASPCLAPR